MENHRTKHNRTPTRNSSNQKNQNQNQNNNNSLNNNNNNNNKSRHRSTLSSRLTSAQGNPIRRHPKSSLLTSNQSDSAIDVLRKLIQARWDPVTKLLDLTNLAQDKILKAGGIPAPGQRGAPLKTAGAIWKLCQEICPNVRSISLAENQLQSLQPMSMSILVNTLPELANLSLAGNKLRSFSELNSLSPIVPATGPNHTPKQGFSQLRELILTGNPVRLKAEKEGPEGLQSYLFEACRRFPTLEVLDGQVVDPALKANLPSIPIQPPAKKSAATPPTLVQQPPLPMSIQPAFFDDVSTSTFVAGFCLQFFNAFDHDRPSLIDVYATKASFSLVASPSIPARSKAAGLTRNTTEMPAQQVPSWNDYISISRNNARLKGPKLCERLATGPAQIIELFNKSIPRTKHPLDSIQDQHKFVVDAWQMNGLVNDLTSHNGAVIYLTIHGQFQEFPGLTVRSFDRTFVLGAAGAASAATLKGWPCVILTDQLTVRGYSSPAAWTPTSAVLPPPPTLPAVTGSNSSTIPAILVSAEGEPTTEEKNGLIKRLMEVTKLNLDFSVDCLTQNHWNLDRALTNFADIVARGGLPDSAFLPQS